MKTLKLISLFAFFLFCDYEVFAQPPEPGKREQIENMKIAFITKKVNLNSLEAQSFWPVYNEFHNKLDELRKSKRQIFGPVKKNMDNLNDKEIEEILQQHFDFKLKELELQKEFHTKFKSVLPVKKVAALYAAEEEFKRELLRKIKKHE